MVDVFDDTSPGLESLKVVGVLEHRVGRVQNADVQESPESGVEVLQPLWIQRDDPGLAQPSLGGPQQDLERQAVAALPLLDPWEQLEQSRDLTDEVPPDAALLFQAALGPNELEVADGQLEVEDPGVHVVQGAETATSHR